MTLQNCFLTFLFLTFNNIGLFIVVFLLQIITYQLKDNNCRDCILINNYIFRDNLLRNISFFIKITSSVRIPNSLSTDISLSWKFTIRKCIQGMVKRFLGTKPFITKFSAWWLRYILIYLEHSIPSTTDYYQGIRGIANDWVVPYLKDRTRIVAYKSLTSDPCPVTKGVPQGSTLGPLFFIMNMQNIHVVRYTATLFKLMTLNMCICFPFVVQN